MTIANGERFDFLISTEGKEAKSYQMTFAGAEGSWTDCSGLATLAFIQYEDTPVDQTAVPDYAGGIGAFFIGLAYFAHFFTFCTIFHILIILLHTFGHFSQPLRNYHNFAYFAQVSICSTSTSSIFWSLLIGLFIDNLIFADFFGQVGSACQDSISTLIPPFPSLSNKRRWRLWNIESPFTFLAIISVR